MAQSNDAGTAGAARGPVGDDGGRGAYTPAPRGPHQTKAVDDEHAEAVALFIRNWSAAYRHAPSISDMVRELGLPRHVVIWRLRRLIKADYLTVEKAQARTWALTGAGEKWLKRGR